MGIRIPQDGKPPADRIKNGATRQTARTKGRREDMFHIIFRMVEFRPTIVKKLRCCTVGGGGGDAKIALGDTSDPKTNTPYCLHYYQ